jgi:hypothetical protein
MAQENAFIWELTLYLYLSNIFFCGVRVSCGPMNLGVGFYNLNFMCPISICVPMQRCSRVFHQKLRQSIKKIPHVYTELLKQMHFNERTMEMEEAVNL